MESVKSRNKWNFYGGCNNILKNRDALVRSYIAYMLNRTLTIFEYDNLPNTIPKKDFELITQIVGCCTISEVNGKLYAFYGGLGGIPNEYYLPTLSVVANPYLKLNKVYEIGKNCEVILNDSMYVGLTPMFDKYANMITDVDISLKFATINTRIPMVAVASDDNIASSFNTLFENVEKGDNIKSIVAPNLMEEETFKTRDYFSRQNNNIKDLIELRQYLLGCWYNELGIQSNFNMKRESLNENEIGMNLDALVPLIDNMLEERKKGWERVNKLYKTNVQVRLSNLWLKIRNEITNNTYESGEENETIRNDSN